MKYEFTRIEARVIPELDGRENVVQELVIGLTGDNGDGISGYRDTLVRLPAPDDSDWVPFSEIDEAWVLAIAERAASENKWRESIDREIESKKDRPVSKMFSFQQEAQRIALENLRAAEREKEEANRRR